MKSKIRSGRNRNRKIIAVGSLLFLLSVGICGCGTNQADGTSSIPQVTEQASQESENVNQAASEVYLDMSGGTETDYSKYETDSTEIQNSEKSQEKVAAADNPAPVDTSEVTIDTESQLTCELTVTCATVLNHMDDLTEGKESLIPSDGVIYSDADVVFYEGETVFDVLQREMKEQKIQMEHTSAPAYGSAYIEGINNLYEFDCGQNSGWMYSVNGWYPNYGCSQYQLKDKDVIQWAYTCDLGKDLEGN